MYLMMILAIYGNLKQGNNINYNTFLAGIYHGFRNKIHNRLQPT